MEGDNIGRKKTHTEYVKELADKNSNIIVIDQYIDAKTSITHKCLIHGIEWKARPDNILHGKGCPFCSNECRRASQVSTHEEYVRNMKKANPDVAVIGRYINASTKIMHKCLIHDIEWEMIPSNALKGCGCPKCHTTRISASKTRQHEWYINEVASISPHILVVGKYVGRKIPIKHYCTKHDVEWDTRPEDILRGSGCRLCGREKISANGKKTFDEYRSELKSCNPDIICIGEYECATKHARHRCMSCGYEWYATPSNILFGTGCPNCNESRGEKNIKIWLNEHNIAYTTQKKFDDCVDKHPLPFDFYLPDYNKLIEYDGRQHFEPVDYFGGQSAFEKLIYHDHIKTEYCVKNNIDLLRIPYYKDIFTELNNYIFTQ